MLACHLRVRRGPFELDAALGASAGEVVAVVGPNGSGKSTLLRGLAGLVDVDGTVTLDAVDATATAAYRRAVGWVPQDGALFPHLSARDNVAFALGGRRGRSRADELLAGFGIADLADRLPAQLSGGQGQKVALARALARDPRLLLLDEPLAALDVTARADVRRVLRDHLAGFAGATLVVTHDPVDIVSLAHRVVALDHGRVVQDAPVSEVVRAPRSPWLAELMGGNACPGRLHDRTVSLDGGGELTAAEAPEPRSPDGAGVPALAVIPAHAVALHRDRPDSSARNCWPVVVRDLTAIGSRVRVRCDGRPAVVAEVTPAAVADLGVVEGAPLWASVKATEVTIVPL